MSSSVILIPGIITRSITSCIKISTLSSFLYCSIVNFRFFNSCSKTALDLKEALIFLSFFSTVLSVIFEPISFPFCNNRTRLISLSINFLAVIFSSSMVRGKPRFLYPFRVFFSSMRILSLDTSSPFTFATTLGREILIFSSCVCPECANAKVTLKIEANAKNKPKGNSFLFIE